MCAVSFAENTIGSMEEDMFIASSLARLAEIHMMARNPRIVGWCVRVILANAKQSM